MPVYKRNYAYQNTYRGNDVYELETFEEKEAAYKAFFRSNIRGSVSILTNNASFGDIANPIENVNVYRNLDAFFVKDLEKNREIAAVVSPEEFEKTDFELQYKDKKSKWILLQYEDIQGNNIILRFEADEPVSLDLD